MSDNKESILLPDEKGNIHIAEDVVASIAALAAADVEGVHSMAGGGGLDIGEWLGRKNLTRGVKITVENNCASVEISLLVLYGHPVAQVGRRVQESVKSAVESMTGLSVSSVGVHIAGVAFEKGKPAAKK